MDSSVKLCEKQCASDAQCTSPGGHCLDSASGQPPANLCTVNCNPASNAGCPAGDACRIATTGVVNRTYCGGKGSGGQEVPCGANADCKIDFICANDAFDGEVCQKLCTIPGGNCAGGYFCNDTGISVGGIEYGICGN